MSDDYGPMTLANLGSAAPSRFDSIMGALKQTWPAKMTLAALDAIALPGQVAAGVMNVRPSAPGMWSDEDEARSQGTQDTMVRRSMDLAGLVMGGSYAAPAVKNSVGMGVRSVPSDNYLTPLSKYTDRVYRETSPEAALEVLPGSNVYGGVIPGGAQRLYYADTPELALGQGANKGVRVGYDASALEGQINQSKPGWSHMFEQGMAEYTAMPARGQDIREAVKSIQIDKAALAAAPRPVRAQFTRLVDKLKSSGWDASDSKQYTDLVRKYGLAGGMAGAGAIGSGHNAEAGAGG